MEINKEVLDFQSKGRANRKSQAGQATEMTIQESLKVEASMPAILAVNEAMYNKAAKESGFKMPSPHHPRDWSRECTVRGYEKRFNNWLHKLNHHLHCKAVDLIADERKVKFRSVTFKTGSI